MTLQIINASLMEHTGVHKMLQHGHYLELYYFECGLLIELKFTGKDCMYVAATMHNVAKSGIAYVWFSVTS